MKNSIEAVICKKVTIRQALLDRQYVERRDIRLGKAVDLAIQ